MSVRMQAHGHALAPGHASSAQGCATGRARRTAAVTSSQATGRRFGAGLFLRQSDVTFLFLLIALAGLLLGAGSP